VADHAAVAPPRRSRPLLPVAAHFVQHRSTRGQRCPLPRRRLPLFNRIRRQSISSRWPISWTASG